MLRLVRDIRRLIWSNLCWFVPGLWGLVSCWSGKACLYCVLHVCLHFQIYSRLPTARRQQPHLWGHGNAQVFWNVSGCFQRLLRSGRGHWGCHRNHIFSFFHFCLNGSIMKLCSLTIVPTWPSSPSWGISSCWRRLSSSSCRGARSCWQRPVDSQVTRTRMRCQPCQEWQSFWITRIRLF